MIARYSSAIFAGSATTFFLFFFMQSLIAMQPGVTAEPKVIADVWPAPVREEQEVRTMEYPPIDPIIRNVTQAPPRPVSGPGEFGKIGVPVAHLPAPTGSPERLSFRMSDGPLVSIVRVQPVYPARALAQNLEGWVVVEFDVRADGMVGNAYAVESSHRVFERAAVAAVLKFRYKPRVVDGIPQATTGLRNILRFELEND